MTQPVIGLIGNPTDDDAIDFKTRSRPPINDHSESDDGHALGRTLKLSLGLRLSETALATAAAAASAGVGGRRYDDY